MKCIQLNEEDTSRLACGLISDLSHYLGNKVDEIVDDVVPILIQVLQQPNFDPKTKLAAINALGDVCMDCEVNFSKYIDQAMQSIL